MPPGSKSGGRFFGEGGFDGGGDAFTRTGRGAGGEVAPTEPSESTEDAVLVEPASSEVVDAIGLLVTVVVGLARETLVAATTGRASSSMGRPASFELLATIMIEIATRTAAPAPTATVMFDFRERVVLDGGLGIRTGDEGGRVPAAPKSVIPGRGAPTAVAFEAGPNVRAAAAWVPEGPVRGAAAVSADRSPSNISRAC